MKKRGKVKSIRPMGKSIFADLDDIQILITNNDVGSGSFTDFKRLKIDDIIEVKGELIVTRSGTDTIKVREWRRI